MNLTGRQVEAVSRTRVEFRRATGSAFQVHLTAHDVDHRLMRPMVMPARRAAGLGTHDSDPQSAGVDGLLADHPRRLSGLLMAIGRPDQPGLLFLHRSPLFLLGLPALVLDVQLRAAAPYPRADPLARLRVRG